MLWCCNRFVAPWRRKSDGTIPLEFFRDILDEYLREEEVQRQIETVLNWGRYAEVFTYDSETDRLLSRQPTSSANPNVAPLH
jgi:hypothetical protein